jgi:ketosteroid isomerase-like protein
MVSDQDTGKIQEVAAQRLRRAYEAFNARDVEAALALMHSDVDWPNAIEGGRVRGHHGLRSYWAGQFAVIDPRAEPLRFTLRSDGRVVHVYTLRDGLVERMDIEEAKSA